jgi:hypothetical protein
MKLSVSVVDCSWREDVAMSFAFVPCRLVVPFCITYRFIPFILRLPESAKNNNETPKFK